VVSERSSCLIYWDNLLISIFKFRFFWWGLLKIWQSTTYVIYMNLVVFMHSDKRHMEFCVHCIFTIAIFLFVHQSILFIYKTMQNLCISERFFESDIIILFIFLFKLRWFWFNMPSGFLENFEQMWLDRFM
jgi:hypothetical protein